MSRTLAWSPRTRPPVVDSAARRPAGRGTGARAGRGGRTRGRGPRASTALVDNLASGTLPEAQEALDAVTEADG